MRDPVYARYKRNKLIMRIICMTVPVLLIGGGGAMYYLYRQATAKPDYWYVVKPYDPGVKERAQEFENTKIYELTKVRPAGEAFEVELPQREFNEWIAMRMPKYLENKKVQAALPENVKYPMVHVNDETLTFAAEFNFGEHRQIISMDFRPTQSSDGTVKLELDARRVGNVGLPDGPVIEEAIKRYGSLDAAQQAAMDKARDALSSIEMTIPIDGNREVRVVDMQLRRGTIILTCEAIEQTEQDPALTAVEPARP